MSQSSDTSSSRKRRPPPQRLGWPAAAALDASVHSPKTKKRVPSYPRRVTFTGQKKVTQPSNQMLWIKKHAPSSSSQLCVAPKKIKEVKEWMEQHQPPECKLLLLVGSPGVGKSAMVHCLAAEMGLEVLEWTESYFEGAAVSIEHVTPLHSLEKFLQQTGAGYRSLQLEMESNKDTKKHRKTNGSLIVLDELPNLHGAEMETRFKNILATHAQQTAVPTVLIYSDVAEGKVQSDDLERLVESTVLYSPSCKIVHINTPTTTKFKKTIKDIAAIEGSRIGSDYADELHFRCNGDMRFAITTMQYEVHGVAFSAGTKQRHLQSKGDDDDHDTSAPTTIRDTSLMPFHALGKLLYAKRRKVFSHRPDQRPPLEFDPESVVERSGMETGNVLCFLEYHCVEFFTDMDELAAALHHFSDGATLLDCPVQDVTNSSSTFPTPYVASLAGRTVAETNRHPAPSSFRSFGAPKVFDVMRKKRENAMRIRHICASRNVTESTTSPSTFALDVLPFARSILPLHHISTSFLDSYFAATVQKKNMPDMESDMQMKEQEEILRLDDITDYDEEW